MLFCARNFAAYASQNGKAQRRGKAHGCEVVLRRLPRGRAAHFARSAAGSCLAIKRFNWNCTTRIEGAQAIFVDLETQHACFGSMITRTLTHLNSILSLTIFSFLFYFSSEIAFSVAYSSAKQFCSFLSSSSIACARKNMHVSRSTRNMPKR